MSLTELINIFNKDDDTSDEEDTTLAKEDEITLAPSIQSMQTPSQEILHELHKEIISGIKNDEPLVLESDSPPENSNQSSTLSITSVVEPLVTERIITINPRKTILKNKRKHNTSVSRSKRAGLCFPVGRVERHLRLGRYSKRISNTAAVYLAAVLEYFSAEVLEIAGNACRDFKRIRITPRHLLLAVANDKDLSELMCCSKNIIAGAGSLTHVPDVLLPSKKDKKGAKKNKKKVTNKNKHKPSVTEENEEKSEYTAIEQTEIPLIPANFLSGMDSESEDEPEAVRTQ